VDSKAQGRPSLGFRVHARNGGSTLLNVLKVRDMPKPVALAFPRSVTLHETVYEDRKKWVRPDGVQTVLGKKRSKSGFLVQDWLRYINPTPLACEPTARV